MCVCVCVCVCGVCGVCVCVCVCVCVSVCMCGCVCAIVSWVIPSLVYMTRVKQAGTIYIQSSIHCCCDPVTQAGGYLSHTWF